MSDVLQPLSHLQSGDHACLLYERPEQALGVLAAWVRQGLARGERCLWAAGDAAAAEAALAGLGVEVERERAAGALVLCAEAEAWPRPGGLDVAGALAFVGRAAEEALAAGFRALRLAGEPGRLADGELAGAYEAALDRFLPGRPVLALCARDARGDCAAALRHHAHVLVGGDLLPNPYHEPPAAPEGEAARARGRVERLRRLAAAARAREEAAADAARRRARELEAVLESTHAQLALLGADMTFLMVNSAYEKACGHTKAELLGRSHFDFFPDADNEAIFRRVAATGEACYRMEKPFQYADQPERGVTWWNWSLVPIKDERGHVEGVLLSLLDVTWQVRARERERELRREAEATGARLRELAEEAKRETELRERLMAILGHDLRQPLHAIATSTSVLLRRLGDERDVRTLERVDRGARRMAGMIGDLLDYTRSRSQGGIPVAPAAADLREIARQAVDEASAGAPGRDVRLEVAGDCTGRWDPDRLHQAITNLVANALVHGHPESAITVSVYDEDGAVAVQVVNRGEPIAPEVLPELFEAFRRAPGRERPAGGLGLGLYIVREIVRAHGGRVEATSTPEGVSRFRFVLPRTVEAKAAGA